MNLKVSEVENIDQSLETIEGYNEEELIENFQENENEEQKLIIIENEKKGSSGIIGSIFNLTNTIIGIIHFL
jgi:hypothetical protein